MGPRVLPCGAAVPVVHALLRAVGNRSVAIQEYAGAVGAAVIGPTEALDSIDGLTVVEGRHRQPFAGKVFERVFAVGIGERAAGEAGARPVLAGLQEIPLVAGAAAVAVGEIHQVDVPVGHVQRVPHMVATGNAAAHQLAGHVPVKVAQVAQVLEALGIALADHLRAVVAVEDVHQLPGVAVGGIAVARRIVVVCHQAANYICIGLQLGQVVLARIVRDNALDIGGRGGHPGGQFVHLIGADRAGFGIVHCDSEFRGQGCQSGLSILLHDPEAPGHAAGHLVKPVELVGIIRQQGLQDLLLHKAFL